MIKTNEALQRTEHQAFQVLLLTKEPEFHLHLVPVVFILHHLKKPLQSRISINKVSKIRKLKMTTLKLMKSLSNLVEKKTATMRHQ